MNTPKISRRKRDGVWFIIFYENNNRVRKSLGTKNEIEAKLKFGQITGLNVPTGPVQNANAITAPPGAIDIKYVDAVNEFMLSMYGIQNAWTAKRKPRCALKSTTNLGLFKRFQDFTNIYHINEVTYASLQGYISSILGTVKNDTVNKHIARLRRFLEFCENMEYIQNNHAKKTKNL